MKKKSAVFVRFSQNLPRMHSLYFVSAILWSAYVLSDPDPQDIHLHIYSEDAAHKDNQTQKAHKALYIGWKAPPDHGHMPCHRSSHTQPAHALEQNLK